MSKTFSAAPATQAALFPDLLGQMVDSETDKQPFLRRGTAMDSKATTARLSKKASGDKNRKAEVPAISEPGPSPAAAEAVRARAKPPWLLQGGKLWWAAASVRPSSETGHAGSDAAAGRTSPPLARPDAETAAVPAQLNQSSGTPGGAVDLRPVLADTGLQCAHGERPSNAAGDSELTPAAADKGPAPAGVDQSLNPITEVAGAPADQFTEPVRATGRGPAPTEQTLEPPRLRAAASAAPNAVESAAARAAQPEPVAAVSTTQIAASASLARSNASPGGRTSETASKPAEAASKPGEAAGKPGSPTQNMAYTRAPEQRATDAAAAAQVARTIAAEGMNMVTGPLPQAVVQSGDRTAEADHADEDRSGDVAGDLTAADDSSQPGVDSLSQQGTLAFQALLVPLPGPDPQPAGQELWEGDAYGQHPYTLSSGDLSGGRSDDRSTRDQAPVLAVAVPPGQTGGAPQAASAAQGVSTIIPVPSNASATAAPKIANPHHDASAASASRSAQDSAEQAFAPKPAAGGAARQIQLELHDDGSRVNVRLVERAGSVQVDVRTPDSHLAGALRDDLPSLTARLEQSGLRAEAWHDAPAVTAARIRTAEPVANAGSASSQNQSRREGGDRDPRDGQPREKRQNQPQPESKEFSWHFTSLQ